MYGLPVCYWLIDEGEEKDSVLQQKKKNGEKKANNDKIESINLLSCAFVYLAYSPLSVLTLLGGT